MDSPPDWAIKSALDRIGSDFGGGSVWTVSDIKANAPSPLPYQRMTLLAAKLIATHESPPVDPLREEAIALVLAEAVTRTDNQIHAIKAGIAGEGKIELALTALRRGMELERERSK